KLTFDYEPDKYYKVRYSGSLDTTRFKTMTNLVIPLTAFDPHAYSVIDTSDDVLWGDDIPFLSDIPLGIGDYQYSVTSPSYLRVENLGSLVVRPIIEITGSASSMTLNANGKNFSVGGFPEGTTLLIDSTHYVVMKDGQNYIHKMTGDFLELMPGANTVGVGGTNLNINITFKFRAKYM
ncbi:phage tail protein, partial [Bacillus cereus]